MNATTFINTVAAAVRERRHTLALTQKQLASMAGVSERLVRLIEAGQAPGVGIEKLAMVLSPLGLELALEGDVYHAAASEDTSAENDEYERLLQYAVSSWEGVGTNGK
ncbi:hypothetical protein [Adlercreutzia sp. ZJ138]|uniref:hypothetical protein n=1 Tax=Adlercreutzia sp. ZJ138 TaxID=2709405 RepID=UPI0013ED9E7A|nr:hypothetical protein [Adlercreutzia sp. ZJ138]